jgi:hypothetical protein
VRRSRHGAFDYQPQPRTILVAWTRRHVRAAHDDDVGAQGGNATGHRAKVAVGQFRPVVIRQRQVELGLDGHVPKGGHLRRAERVLQEDDPDHRSHLRRHVDVKTQSSHDASPTLWSVTVNILPGNTPLGRRIHNRYRVDGYLGGGKNGHVYEVWDEKQKQRVALKLMDASRAAPVGTWFEAEVLTGLRGDFILPILNADDEAGAPFIVTEVMHNGSCADAIVAGVGVAVDRAARWTQQGCVGVSRIHDLGLLHNDIKPANLFLDADDNVLVGDLGLSCLRDASGNGHAAGSVETMAPEVARASPTTIRTDVYSLGATLYQLLAGHPLNPELEPAEAAGATPQQIWAMVATHTPKPLGDVAPHVPQGLRQIVMRAVDPDPANRYAAPADLGAAIGSRTRLPRVWARDAPCPGHTTCFTGMRPGAATFKVCAVPTGNGARQMVQAHRVPAGTRINTPAWKEVTPAKLAQELRAHINALT